MIDSASHHSLPKHPKVNAYNDIQLLTQHLYTHPTKLSAVIDTSRPIYHVTEQIHNSSLVNSLWTLPPHQVS